MKLFHWRISKSTLLLGFNIFLVITAAFLLLVNIQSRRELEDSKRGFYSEQASYLINEEGVIQKAFGKIKAADNPAQMLNEL